MSIKKPFYRIIRPWVKDISEEDTSYVTDPRYAADRSQLSRAYLSIERELREIFNYIEPDEKIRMYFLLNFTACYYVLAQR